MTEPILIYRLEDLSINFHMKDLFSSFGFITVVNEFPRTIATVPTIAVVNGKLSESMFELGNRKAGLRTRKWYIDIYAINISQRDDFAYRILNNTDDGINVYDYNEGFPPDASPSLVNHLSVTSKTYEPIDTIPTSENKILYYRGQLILITQNDKV